MTYWIDANVLIQCKNKIYKFQRYPEFWSFLSVQLDAQTVRSSEFVYAELVNYNDELAAWCKSRKSGSINTKAGADVQACYSKIVDFVEGNRRYERQHKEEFYAVADGWLIAHAMADQGTVVTHETPRETGKIKVNSICTKFSIPFIDIFQLQDKLNFNPADYRR